MSPSRWRSIEDSLGSLTAALAQAETDEEIAAAVDVAIRQVVPDAQVIVRASGADGRLHALGSAASWMPPVDPRVRDEIPGPDVLFTGRPRWDVPAAQWQAAMTRWRERAGAPTTEPDPDGRGNIVPLMTGRAPIGVLIALMRDGRSLEETERAYLLAVAGQLAQALYGLRAIEPERSARLQSDRARARLSFLGQMSTQLVPLVHGDGSDDWRFLHRFAEMATPRIADTCFVRTYDDHGRMRLVATSGPEEVVGPLRLLASNPFAPTTDAALRRGEIVLYDRLDLGRVRALDPHLAERAGAVLGDISAMVHIPLVGGTGLEGVVSLTCSRRISNRTFDADDDAVFFAEIANRFRMMLGIAGQLGRGRRIVETFQTMLLPEALPRVPGIDCAARYLPASDEAEVGGDWFELVELSDGRLAAAVGDVVGSGIEVAAKMGQFRTAMRALALDGSGPSRLLERLSEFTTGLAADGAFATAFVASLDPVRGEVRYASAGHPPAYLARASGTVIALEDAAAVPLGVESGMAYPEGVLTMGEGDTLVLYTDGLVERRGEDLEVGLERLRTAIAAGAPTAQMLVTSLIDTVADGANRDDDIAVLVLRLLHRSVRFELTLPSARASVAEFRAGFGAWLADLGVGTADRDDLVLAVSEACSNAVEHGGGGVQMVHLVAELRGDEIAVSVRDRGRWRPPSVRPERGRGMGILRQVTDSLEVRRRRGGTEVRMHRRLGVR